MIATNIYQSGHSAALVLAVSFLTIVAAVGQMISRLRTSWKPAARVRDTGQQETKQCHLSNRQHNLHRAIRLDEFWLGPLPQQIEPQFESRS